MSDEPVLLQEVQGVRYPEEGLLLVLAAGRLPSPDQVEPQDEAQVPVPVGRGLQRMQQVFLERTQETATPAGLSRALLAGNR